MDDSLIARIKNLYGLNDPIPETFDMQGLSSDTFMLNDGERKLFVKGYNSLLSENDLEAIHAAKFYFFKNGIPAIVPILTDKKQSFFSYGERFYGVFPRVFGRTYHELPTERTAISMGNMLARIHTAGQDQWPLVRGREFVFIPDAEANQDARKLIAHIESLPEKNTVDDAFYAFIRYKQDLIQKQPLGLRNVDFKRDYVIHGDFHLRNVFFHDEDTVSHVFDFEYVARGPRCTELIYSLFATCFIFDPVPTPEEREMQFERAKVFLQSYLEAFPLSIEEISQGLKWYLHIELLRRFIVEKQYYFGDNPKAQYYLHERTLRTQYVVENYELIRERFLSYAADLHMNNQNIVEGTS